MPFEAVAYTPDRKDFISNPEWTWEFGDDDKSASNPTEHAYEKEGSYTVIVTATAKEGTGTAETTVEVVAGDGGGDQLLVSNLYMRDPITKATVGVPCDVVQVVFETTDSMVMELKLWRQPPPDVPNTWHEMGGATYENTGIPGLQRWYWTWLTLGDKNWPVNLKVTYKKPGTPPPFPPPMVPVTFGPVTWTPNNTVVHSDDVILPWNGTDALTISWTITHANRDNPRFTVTVFIYMIDSTSPIKTFTLTNQGLGAGSVPWNGEVNQGMPPAQPGIYTYQVSAVHNAFPMCQNGDKSGQLTPSVTELWQINRNTQADTVKVMAECALNRDAGAARIEVWGADPATGDYPVGLGGLNCTDVTAGAHLTSSAVIPVELDAGGELTHPLHAVIFATETGADGQNNRDLQPKFAMQKNDETPIKPEVSCAALGFSGDHKMLVWNPGELNHDQEIDPDDTHFLWPPDEDEDDCPAEVCYTKALPVTMFGKFAVANVPDTGLTGVSVRAKVEDAVVGEKGGLTTVDGELHDGDDTPEVVNDIGPGSPVPGGDHVRAMQLAPTWEFSIDGGDWEPAAGGGGVTAFWTESTPLLTGAPPADCLYDLGLAKACAYVNGDDGTREGMAATVADWVHRELIYRLDPPDPVHGHHPLTAYEPGFEGVLCDTHALVMVILTKSIGVNARAVFEWGGCNDTTQCLWWQGAAPVTLGLSAEQEDDVLPNPHFRFHMLVEIDTDVDPNTTTWGAVQDPTYGEMQEVSCRVTEGPWMDDGAQHSPAAQTRVLPTPPANQHSCHLFHCVH